MKHKSAPAPAALHHTYMDKTQQTARYQTSASAHDSSCQELFSSISSAGAGAISKLTVQSSFTGFCQLY
jgi:hypothetical protein